MSPPKHEVRIAIIGAGERPPFRSVAARELTSSRSRPIGISGMILAIELKKRLNIDTFTIYERMADVGGTWRVSRACQRPPW